MKLLPLSIFVTLATAAAIPAANPIVHEANLPAVENDADRANRTCTRRIDCGEGVCWEGRCYYERRQCIPDGTCDIGECHHGYCYIDYGDIPPPRTPPQETVQESEDNDNGDMAKRDGILGLGNDDESYRRMFEAIRAQGKDKAKRDSSLLHFGDTVCSNDEDCVFGTCDNGQCGISGELYASMHGLPAKRDVGDELDALLSCDTDGDCSESQWCRSGKCFFEPLPGVAKREAQTTKDPVCHKDIDCAPGVCVNGLCIAD